MRSCIGRRGKGCHVSGRVKKIIKEGKYDPRQVFNCDETGLFWKKMPNRTCIHKSAKQTPGFKARKDRLTLVLCGNEAGHTRRVQKETELLKKRPTSTESAPRLLNGPSPRFWQLTAICPVSLWALVVELHPLNWACAQTVRRISDKVTMKELEEQRVCV